MLPPFVEWAGFYNTNVSAYANLLSVPLWPLEMMGGVTLEMHNQ